MNKNSTLAAAAALTLVTVSTALMTDCNVFSPTDWICPPLGGSQGILQKVYAVALDPNFTPHPVGYQSLPQGYSSQLLYGCGQPVCATSLAEAKAALVNAVATKGISASDPRLFVVLLGGTGQQINAAEPGAVISWVSAGSPCIGSDADASAPDAGPECLPLYNPNSSPLGQICQIPVQTPSKACCVPLKCNPIAMFPAEGTCCIDTANDQESTCTDDTQCCVGYCGAYGTCACQLLGEVCGKNGDCCGWPYQVCDAATLSCQYTN